MVGGRSLLIGFIHGDLARFEGEIAGPWVGLGERRDWVVVAVEPSEEHLLCVQAAQRLTELVVRPQVLCVHWVGDLGGGAIHIHVVGAASAGAREQPTARVLGDSGSAVAAPARVGLDGAVGCPLQAPHLEVGVVHLAPQLLEVLKVF